MSWTLPTPFQEAAIFIALYIMARASVTRGRVKSKQAEVSSSTQPTGQALRRGIRKEGVSSLTATEQEERKGRRGVKKEGVTSVVLSPPPQPSLPSSSS